MNIDIYYKEEDIKNILNFLTLIASKKEESLAYLNTYFFDIYKEKKDIIDALTLCERILDKEIKFRYKIQDEKFLFYDIINTYLKNILLTDLIYYLNKIVEFKNKLVNNPNLNINLFFDRFVIEMSKVVL